ncbi:hypothetical protein [Ornithinimicrobium cryptoxanthini]|uniref:hypothetical protein n=1 Tax=Ornithinimicrobium cryptoxanthini TaxID=2934161 RepID=UPI002117BDF3|nr:hypothetical protein [Ornithinimicrobium cryptoxanthini]
MSVGWVEVECRHEGRGTDAAAEVVHRQYVGEDARTLLLAQLDHARTARMVHEGALADTPGDYRRNRHKPDTYAHRQLRCSTCGFTERVRADWLTRALILAADAEVEHLPLSGIRRIVDGID